MDAGSIPYSAVTQPRPDPIIHRGTLSCTEAVQITRVSPIEISAEPVAVRTKPGSIVAGRSCGGRAAVAALPRLMPPLSRRGGPPTDLAQRHLQKAGAEGLEGGDVAGAAKAVAALARRAG